MKVEGHLAIFKAVAQEQAALVAVDLKRLAPVLCLGFKGLGAHVAADLKDPNCRHGLVMANVVDTTL